MSRKLTLREVETRSGVSATHLSEIERGRTSPTVGALIRLARALGVDPARLVEADTAPRASVVRAGERRMFVENGFAFHRLSRPVADADMSLFEVEVTASAESPDVLVGAGELFVFVLRGSVEVTLVDARRVVLEEGDACHTGRDGMRAMRAVSGAPARLLCAAAPAVIL